MTSIRKIRQVVLLLCVFSLVTEYLIYPLSLSKFRTEIIELSAEGESVPDLNVPGRPDLSGEPNNVEIPAEGGFDFCLANASSKHGKCYITSTDSDSVYVSIKYAYRTDGVSRSISVNSSNESVASVTAPQINLDYLTDPSYERHGKGTTSMNVTLKEKPGVSVISLTIGDVSRSIAVVVLPAEFECEAEQVSLHQSRLSWKAIDGVDGYLIQTAEGKDRSDDKYDYKNAVFVNDPKAETGLITTKENTVYHVRVVPYLIYGGKLWGNAVKGIKYETKKVGTSGIKVTNEGTSYKLTWDKAGEAVAYEIYSRDCRTGVTKQEGITKSADETVWSVQMQPGEQKLFYVVTVYSSEKSDPSENVMICAPVSYSPNTTGKAKKAAQNKIKMDGYLNGQYDWGNWASTEPVTYFSEEGKLYMASAVDKKLYIYEMNPDTLKLKKKKTVSLGKTYQTWGGFYHAPDHMNYVVTGRGNKKESKTKKVIRVQKYDSAWNLKGTCEISGNATNVFEGIQYPFDAGSVRMEMIYGVLYIATCRTMFVHADGLNHQSNIAFRVFPDTMTYTDSQDTYVSHSFNQYVRFDRGELYLVNHGDAYPRAVELEICHKYDPITGIKDTDDDIEDDTENQEKPIHELQVFKLKGKTGLNRTNLCAGGLEVGVNKALTCGISTPHSYPVNGVKGWEKRVQNVYVTVTDLKDKKTEVKWITKYGPKKSKTTVGEVRMVKLADDRMALLYQETKKKNKKLCYTVIDEDGNIISKKTYKNYRFSGSSQPILYNGYIYWAERPGFKKTYQYRIPA